MLRSWVRYILLFGLFLMAGNMLLAQNVKLTNPSGITDVCTGVSATLEFEIGGGAPVGPNFDYTYTIDGGAPITVTGPNPHSISVNVSGTYVVTGCVDLGTGLPIPVNAGNDTEVLNALPEPSLFISPDPATAGIGTNLNLTANGSGGTVAVDYTYSWSGANIVSATNIQTITFNSGAVGVYPLNCIITDDNGCQGSDNINVNVINLTADIGGSPGPLNVCAGSAYNLDGIPSNGSGSYTHAWSGAPAGALSSTTVEDPVFTYSTSGTYTLTYTVTDVGIVPNVSVSENIDIIVNPLPLDKTINVVNRCIPIDGSVTVVSSELGVNYDLYEAVAGFIGTKAGDGNDLVWTLGVGDYSVVATNAVTGCSKTFAGPYTIGAYNRPTVTPSAVDATVCQGSSTLLNANATPAAGSSIPATGYSWDNAATLVPSNTTENPTATPLTSTTYTVIVTDDKGCSSSGSVAVTVTPVPTISIGGTTTICDGESTTLTGISNKTVASWFWEANAPTASAVIGNYTVSPSSNTLYSLTVTDTDGCTSTGTTTVTVNETPVANAGADVEMCDGIGSTLDGSGSTFIASAITNYSWSDGTNNVTTTVTPGINTTYTLTVTNVLGCTDQDQVNVTVLNNPTVTVAVAGGAPNSICHGSSIDLESTPIGGDLSGDGAYDFNWMPGGLSTQNVTVAPTNAPPSAVPITQTYTLTVTDDKGCIGSTTQDVIVNPLPSPITINNLEANYCQDAGTLTLTGSPGGGVWSNPSGGASLTPAGVLDISPTGTTPGVYIIRYTYTDANTCVNFTDQTTTVLANSTPVLSIYVDDGAGNPKTDFCFENTDYSIITTSTESGGGITHTLNGNGVTDLGGGVGTFNPNTAAIGTHTISYTVDVTTGCNTTESIDVNVGLPLEVVLANDTICESIVTYTGISINKPAGAGNGSYLITNPDASSYTVNEPATPYINPSAKGPGDYIIEFSLSDGTISCSNTARDTINVVALPNPSFTLNGVAHTTIDLSYCENGGFVNLLGSPNGGIFSGPGVSGTSFDPAISGPGTHTITYTYTDAYLCQNTVSTSVEVYPTPVGISINGLNASYCEDQNTITITGNPTDDSGIPVPTFGTWTSPWADPTIFLDNGDGTANFTPSNLSSFGTYNITYSVNDAFGCTGSVTNAVTINPLPTVNFTGLPAPVAPATIGKICSNAAAINLFGSPQDANGSFSGDGITDNGNGTAVFDPSGLSIGIHNLVYSYTNGVTSCTNSITKQIEVVALPIAYAVTAAVTDYCSSDGGITIGISGSELAATPPPHYTYALIQNGITQLALENGTGAAFDFPGKYPLGTYTVVATSPDACQVNFANSVTANEFPAIADAGSITGSLNICADGTSMYTYSVPLVTNATDHIWTIPAGATLINDRDNEIDLIFDPAFAGGNLSVYGTDPASVCPDGNSRTVAITPQAIPVDLVGPAPISSSSGAFVFCEGTTGIVFSVAPANFANETSFEWQLSAGAAAITSVTTDASLSVDFGVGSLNGTLRVRAVNSCGTSAWIDQIINVNPIPNVSINPLGAGDVITCDAASEVQLNATSTSVGITSWLWTASNGGIIKTGEENNQNPFVVNEGDYQVRIGVSANGLECYNTSTVSVLADKTAPTVSISPHASLDCAVNSISLQANANTASSFAWVASPTGNIQSGANTDTPVIDAPGTYTVSITDLSNSCIASASTSVSENVTAPNISVVSPANNITCAVNSVVLDGASSTLNANFLWTGPDPGIQNANSEDATVDFPGTYTLTVTDPVNSCTSTANVVVGEDKVLPVVSINNIDLESVNLTCENTQVHLQAVAAGLSDASFVWSTGTGTIDLSFGTYNEQALVSAATQYTATATNPTNGCSASADITINNDFTKPNLVILPSSLNISCNFPSISLDATTSVNADTYAWSASGGGSIVSGASTNTATISSAGTYTLTSTKASTGCVETESIVIGSDLAVPAVSILAPSYSITCSDPDPELGATADAGASILWTGPGIVANANSLNPTVNIAGTYTITATAANGCSSSDNVLVSNDNTPPHISLETNPDELNCVRSSVNLTGSSTTAGVNYLWEVLSGTAVITNPTSSTSSVNAPGDFRLNITAPNGCVSTGDVTVNENLTAPNIVLPLAEADKLTCSQTTVQLDGASSTPSALFSWSTAVVGANITNSNSPTPLVDKIGDYTLTVTDPVNGCTSSATTSVTEDKSTPVINIAAVTQQISCTNTSFQLDGSASTNATNYSWLASNGGSIVSGQNTAQPTINAAGRYTLTAEHTITGCTASAFVDVTEDNSLPNIDIFDPFPTSLTCALTSVNLSADASSLTTNKLISWTTSDGNITSATDIPTPSVNQPGTYTVSITNTDNNCTSVRSVLVEQNITPPSIVINTPLDLTCTRADVDINASASSVDNSALSYNWTAGAGGNISSGASTPDINVTSAATYTLSVQDLGNACINSKDITVTENKAYPDVSVNETPDILNCNQTSIQLNGSSTFPNVAYTWTTTSGGAIINETTQTPTINTAGTYNLEITNLDNGCVSISNDVIVSQNISVPTVTVSIPSGNIDCNNSIVNLSATENVNYNYTWAGPGNISTPDSYTTNVDLAGTYSLILTDKSSLCTNNYTVDVLEDKTADLSPVVANISACFGDVNPSFTKTSGNTLNWYSDVSLSSFLATGDNYTPLETTVGTHSYYVTSTGANGCASLPTEVLFQVNALPAAPIGFNQSICEGSAAQAISALGSNIKWYNNLNVQLGTGNSFTPADVAVGVYNYYATQSDANTCESAKTTVTYTIKTVPFAPSVVDNNLEVCEAETIPEFVASGANISWYENINGAIIHSGTNYQANKSLPGTYTFYLTQTENNCESPETTVNLNINAKPTIFNITGGGTYCEGTGGLSIGLDGSENNIEYQLWKDLTAVVATNVGNGAALNFGNFTDVGNYSVKAVNTVSNCSVFMNSSVSVSVDSLPGTPQNIQAPASICQGDQNVLFEVPEVNNASAYQWSFPAGANIITGPDNRKVWVDFTNSASSGNVSVQASNACGLGPVSPLYNLNLDLIPADAIAINGPLNLCKQDTGKIYTADPIANAKWYKWELPYGFSIQSGDSTRIIKVALSADAISGDIKVSGVNDCGEGNSVSLANIQVNSIPSISANSGGPSSVHICGTTGNLNGLVPVGSTPTWSVLEGSISINSLNNLNSSFSDLAPGYAIIRLSADDGVCVATDDLTIYNDQIPLDDIVLNAPVETCEDFAPVSASKLPTGTSGQWSVSSGTGIFDDASLNQTTIRNLSSGNNTLAWNVTKNACVTTKEISIQNNRPSLPDAGPDTTICGANIQLKANNPAVGSGQWSIIKGFANFNDASLYNTGINSIADGETVLRWTISNGNCSLSDEMTITNLAFSNTFAGSDQYLCKDSTNLTALALPAGTTGTWKVLAGGGTLFDSSDPNTKVNNLSRGTNVFEWTIINNGCESVDQVNVVNNSATQSVLGADVNICNDQITLLANSIDADEVGIWSITNGGGTISNANSTLITVTNLKSGLNTFRWTVQKENCSSYDEMDVFNSSLPEIFAGDDIESCTDTVQLDATPVPDGAFGYWSFVTGTGVIEDGAAAKTIVSDLAPGNNLLRWTINRNGCISSDDIKIVNNVPSVAYAGHDRSICGSSTSLEGQASLFGTGTWSVVNGSAIFTDPNLATTNVDNLGLGETTLRWTITQGQCSDYDEVVITNNKQVVDAGVNQTICGKVADLKATQPIFGDVGYWSNVSGSSIFVEIYEAETKVSGLSEGVNVLKWSIDRQGCISSDLVSITNNAPSIARAGNDTTVNAAEMILNAEIPTRGTGTWSVLSGSGSFDNVNDPKTRVYNLNKGNNILLWTVEHLGCSSSDELLISNQLVGDVNAGVDQVLCRNQTSMDANDPELGYGVWTVHKGSGVFANNEDPNTQVRDISPGINEYVWTVYENGVNSDTVVVINNTPTTANAGEDQSLCESSTFLAGNENLEGVGQWSIIAGAAIFDNPNQFDTKVTQLLSGKNIFRWTINKNGCESTDDVTISTFKPTEAFAGNDQILCTDSTILYNNTPSSGTGYWSVASGSAVIESGKAYQLERGDNILVWTIDNNGCSSADSVLITNNSASDAFAGVDRSVCADTFKLAANEPFYGTGEWTVISGSGTFDNTNAGNTIIRNLNNGSNILRWTITHLNCVSNDEVLVSYDLIPAFAGQDQTVCSDQTALTANNPDPGTGYWSVVGGSGRAVFENPELENTLALNLDRGNNNLRWSVTYKNCVSTDDIVVLNNKPSEPQAGPDQNICKDFASLEAAEPVIGNGVWSILNGSGSIASENNHITQVSQLSYGANTFRWTVKNGECSLADEVVIHNNSVVPANAGYDQTVCSAQTVLYGNHPTFGSGQWSVLSGSGIFEKSDSAVTSINALALGNNVLKWTLYNGNCTSSDEVTITNDQPSRPRAGADITICSDSARLFANLPSVGTGLWSVLSGAGEFKIPNNNITDVLKLNKGKNTLRWTITNNECQLFDEVVVTNNSPFDAYAGMDTHVCGDSTYLFADAPIIGTGRWTIISGEGQFADDQNNETLIRGMGYGANTLRWTVTNQSCSSSDEIIIYNDQAPVFAGTDDVVYDGEATLVGNIPIDGTGTWSIVAGAGSITSPSEYETKVSNLGQGNNTFRWTITTNSCPSFDDVVIKFVLLPKTNFAVNSIFGCPPFTAEFLNNTIGGEPYTWDFGDGTTYQGFNATHIYEFPGKYTVSLTATGQDNETVTKDTLITIFEPTEADFEFAPKKVFIPEQSVHFYNLSTNASKYVWDFGDENTSTELNPIYVYTEEGIFNISLVSISEYGCVDTLLVENGIEVIQSGTIIFPDAFTPNPNGGSDGRYNKNDFTNDVFFPIMQGVEEYNLEIFNRWGVLLFKSDDPEIGWDGYYKGELLNEGVYVWRVYGRFNNGKSFNKAGDVMLLQNEK